VGARRWRPPKVELRFDVTLRNDEPGARWAILPDRFSRPLGDGAARRVYSIDVYELTGNGRAVAAHFLGERGFFALLLPASSEVVLRGLPIAYWGELPDSVELELAFADELLVEGCPAQKRLRIDPLCEPWAHVDAEPLANQAAVVETVAPEADGALSAAWTAGRETRQRIELEEGAARSG
jgi:hypothetical protein